MKINLKLLHLFLLVSLSAFIISCEDDETPQGPLPTGTSMSFSLASVSDPSISGTVNFIENDDNSTTIELKLNGTKSGGQHPAHIHANTAAEGGDIIVTLGTVEGSTGIGTVNVKTTDSGTPISYTELINYNGYINVHNSSTDLGTLVAQGDIGDNVLTGTFQVYQLGSVSDPAIKGTATFAERKSGDALATIQLEGTTDGQMHPGHIHSNTAAEGGGILLTFAPVDGTTGISKTNISKLDDDTPFTYADVLEIDGYINLHLSAEELGTLVAQGDIGQNELTGTSKEYPLSSVAVPTIMGTATFAERKNGEALATIQLDGTPAEGMHPGHIHSNTAAEGGGIVVTFAPVNGATGISKTNISKLDDDTPFTYADIMDFDGYINIHLSAEELGTLVAQGDIGQNELTGTSIEYPLGSVAVPTIMGTATFAERKNGEALATIQLEGTPEDGMHPGHIHVNTAAQGGGILLTFNPVNGATGTSKTNIANLDDDTDFNYASVLDIDGYINIHLSATELGTIVAQGDIGQNALTGTTKEYTFNAIDDANVTGSALFAERKNGNALAILKVEGASNIDHPAHIHMNDAATSGGIIFTFNPLNGATGISKTNVAMLDDSTTFKYENIATVDGYINVHESADNLGRIIGQVNIGSNE